eukprot:Gb_35425 [translate_table: standard]
MPPSNGTTLETSQFSVMASIPNHLTYSHGGRIKINVGGRLFETTQETLRLSGSGSFLADLVHRSVATPVFIDRDPDLFSILLAVIRTGNLPATSEEDFSADEIIEEARFYGMEAAIEAAMAPPSLEGIDMEKARQIVPNGGDFPSVLAAGSDGSVWVGHGNKITVYDWALRGQGSILTEFNTIDSLHRFSPTLAAVGSVDFAGLHIYNAVEGRHEKSLVWTDVQDPRVYDTSVQGICSSTDHLIVSFESRHRENTMLIVDKQTLEVVCEIGRQKGNFARDMAADKLEWLPQHNLLLSSRVHGSTFGYCGYMRLWDVRSGTVVWEQNEPSLSRWTQQVDSFADVVANEELLGIFKVCLKSGDVAMVDMRQLNVEDPWMVLEESNPSLAKGEGGEGNKLSSYGKQMFCSRGGDIEVWSKAPLLGVEEGEIHLGTSPFRRNFVSCAMQGVVTQMEVGGDRMFVGRKENDVIEVWESKRTSRRAKLAQIYPL